MVDTIKVSATSRAPAVAGAIAGVIRKQQPVDVRAIGAAAVYQAIKAIAIARVYLEQDGVEIVCNPTFLKVGVGGEERTAINMAVEVWRRKAPLPVSQHGGDSSPPSRSSSPSTPAKQR